MVIFKLSWKIIVLMLSFRMEHKVTENMDNGDVPTYIDLQTDMEAFFPPSSAETGVSFVF